MSYSLKITRDNDDRRLDHVLRSVWKWIPLGEIMKAIRKGEIRVNSIKVREPGQHVFEGDELITKWPLREEESKNYFNNLGRIKIIFQGENIMLVNKPVGLLVQPDTKNGDSVITRIRGVLNSNSPSAVHRLDRNTTGILAIALNGQALRAMEKLFKERNISKKYLAIVDGKTPDKIQIDAPLFKDAENNLVSVDFENGLKSLSRVTKITGDEKNSLVEIELLTGRTHQARVHMAYIKNPITGDTKYGTHKKFLDNNFKNIKISRPLLHAYKLKFPDNLPDILNEIQGKTFKAPLPDDFLEVMKFHKWELNL